MASQAVSLVTPQPALELGIQATLRQPIPEAWLIPSH